jgi:putative flippase GtrA
MSSSRRSDAAEPRGAFLRFLVAGAVNTGATYALFLGLAQVLPYLVAYAIAYVAGIALAYALAAGFVFRVPPQWSTALRFPLVYVLQFAVGSGVMALLVEAFGVAPAFAAIAAIVASIPVTFVASRRALRAPRSR